MKKYCGAALSGKVVSNGLLRSSVVMIALAYAFLHAIH